MDKDFKSGFVTIVGKPNVGKSTFMNKMLNEKLSIVTPKAQTTRHQIKGILNNDNYQIIFLDTPGFLKPRYELQKRMLDYIKISLKDADCILFMTDAETFSTPYDLELLNLLKTMKIPQIALINKSDLVAPEKIVSIKSAIERYNFDEIISGSLLYDDRIENILNLIDKFLPYNPPYYDSDDISDLPMRFFVQEIVRERIFENFQQEIPYSSTVLVEVYKEFPNKIEIAANIWLERKSQKPILLGKNGEKIKMVRKEAEREIYKVVGKRIKLELWIKIKPNWRKKKNALSEFGYN